VEYLDDLGARFISGGEQELKEVIEAYGERLLRYAATILASLHDAEDVVQDVFIAAYESREGFDGQNLAAWLYRITYNRCINFVKKRRFILFAEIPEQALKESSEALNPPEGFSESTTKALHRLKSKERALIHARIIDERDYKDLAGEMGVSAATLRKRYERAKKKLAEYLLEVGGPEIRGLEVRVPESVGRCQNE
jgi:RNA polymerase sigma-70 factor (ECF subfamily)